MYVPPFISQILDFIYETVLIFILIYFEWRDTENQQLKMRCVQTGSERTTAFLYILLVSSCTAHSKLISITTCFVNHDRHSICRKEMKRQAKQIHVLTTSQHKPFVSQGPVITHRPDWVGRFCWVKEFRSEILRRGNYSVTWLMSEVFSIM